MLNEKISSVSAYLCTRTDYQKKDNKLPLFIKVVIDRKPKNYNLNISIEKKYFNGNSVKTTHPEYPKLNKIIQSKIERFLNASDELKLQLGKFNHRDLELKLDNVFIGFYDFIDKYIEQQSGKNSHGHIKNLRCAKKKLQEFSDYVPWNAIDHQFVKRFESFLYSQNLGDNSVVKYLKKLRAFCNEAKRQGYISKMPFEYVKLSEKMTQRTFLTMAEVNRIEAIQLLNVSEKIKNVAKVFLFACNTGLAYSDLKSLKKADIVRTDDLCYIEKLRVKTNNLMVIPLNNSAKLIMEQHIQLHRLNELLFPKLMSMQKYNDYLKLVAECAGIDKNLSSHVARHTFAMISLNEKGLQFETISKLLGHTKLSTTQVYAKMSVQKLNSEMLKWN